MKNIILIVLILYPLTLTAQNTKKAEFSLGGNFSFPISDEAGDFYFIGGSAGLGYIISPTVVAGGSINYYSIILENESPEDVSSVLGLSLFIKRLFLIENSRFHTYLKLDIGLFIPITPDRIYSILEELSGSIGVEFLMSQKTFLFIDVGCLT